MRKIASFLLAAIFYFVFSGQIQESFATFLLNQGTATGINNTDFLYILQSGVSAKLPGTIMRNPVLDTVNCGQAGVSTCQYNFAAFGGAQDCIRMGAGGAILFCNGTINGVNSYTFPGNPGIAGQLMTSVGNPNGLGNTQMVWSNPPTIGNVAGRFGSMDVCQRGAGSNCSFAINASSTAYTVDGCYLTTTANQASTVASVAGLSAGGAFASNRAVSVTRNSGQTGTGIMIFGCPLDVDEIALIRGQFVTISVVYSTGANFSPTSFSFFLECGTSTPVKFSSGYTGATTVAIASVTSTPNTAATRIQATSSAVVPANCTQAEPVIDFNPAGTAGAADTITIDSLQVEAVSSASSVATQFQYMDFDSQLHKAERHFWKSFPYSVAPASNLGVITNEFVFAATTAGANNEFFYIVSPTSMRVAPSVTLFNPGAANSQIRNETRTNDLTASTSFQLSDRAFGIAGTGSGTTQVGDVLGIQFTVDSGI